LHMIIVIIIIIIIIIIIVRVATNTAYDHSVGTKKTIIIFISWHHLKSFRFHKLYGVFSVSGIKLYLLFW